MAKKSKYYDIVKKWYDRGKWSADVVKEAVAKGWITQEECDEILTNS